jgi:adenylate kinase
MEKANFWSGGAFQITNCAVKGIFEDGLVIDCAVNIREKISTRSLKIPFSGPVTNEVELKDVLLQMALEVGRPEDTGHILQLPFGRNVEQPKDFMFNEVPHRKWVRSYIYEGATAALHRALRADRDYLQNVCRNRMRVKVNFPECNPAFDTYRVGTLLEMIRAMTLDCVEEGLKVRICVQQSLGEGIWTGLPLALSSVRPALEKMDWGGSLTEEEKPQPGDFKGATGKGTLAQIRFEQYGIGTDQEAPAQQRNAALVRFGAIGADQMSSDDDIIIIIAPQNIKGGSVVPPLQEMVAAAGSRPVILINPNLVDVPSAAGKMSVQGRGERKAFEDSFIDLYTLRLLYPSTGGYMYPIRGMMFKSDLKSPYVLYSLQEKKVSSSGREEYSVIAGFPKHPPPSAEDISNSYLSRK